ncbi:LysR family transcriptional regulator [Rhizobium sp. G21]|uniref:LysR family transcriptional regulator n=1 Tax=Rhizobium sp. G21 TaxID=2758439 RepID=UPI001602DD0D|nr:LysR family transcriptional regulator [Rhizobium sp. G21]MBB1247367.1 LysR family transcriptional regulator [Rhizobium sp. G21]
MANNDDMVPLDDLSIFLSVCETGGFRSSAKRLGLSPSTVSEKIAALEDRLRTPLLIRTTRSVTPTDAGRVLAARLRPLFRETRAALQDVQNAQEQVRGLLKLNVTGAVMVDILPPMIDRFLRIHPDVRVEIMVDDRLVDIVAAGCDAGIRYGEHLAQDMIAIPIGPDRQQVALAASPDYLSRYGAPTHPRDLTEHKCIRLRFTSGALVEWVFEKDGVEARVNPEGRLIINVDAADAAIKLACAGHGVIGTFENWLTPYLKHGLLAAVLPEWWSPFEGPQLYFSSRFMPAPLRAFVAMIQDDRKTAAAHYSPKST